MGTAEGESGKSTVDKRESVDQESAQEQVLARGRLIRKC